MEEVAAEAEAVAVDATLVVVEVDIVLRYLVTVVVEPVVAVAYTAVHHALCFEAISEGARAHGYAAIGSFRNVGSYFMDSMKHRVAGVFVVWAVPHDMFGGCSFG